MCGPKLNPFPNIDRSLSKFRLYNKSYLYVKATRFDHSIFVWAINWSFYFESKFTYTWSIKMENFVRSLCKSTFKDTFKDTLSFDWRKRAVPKERFIAAVIIKPPLWCIVSSSTMHHPRGWWTNADSRWGGGGETNPSRILEIEWKESVDDKRVMNS